MVRQHPRDALGGGLGGGTIDDHEVTVHLSEPDYDALFWLAGPLGTMFAPDSVDSLATDANGTGSFEFVNYENAVRMEARPQ